MRAAVVFSIPCVGLLVVVLWLARQRASLEQPIDLHAVSYVGSGECARCHPGHVESFGRTFHRTMTQDVVDGGPSARLAPFEGQELTYGGRTITFVEEEGDRVIRIEGGGESRRYVVERTVGSHRYQQFLAREGDTFLRLPVGYHMEEQRFFHMNEAFLLPDPPGVDEGTVAREDFDRHVTRWNDNCVFCHNVAPSPGWDEARGTFDTHVAELGVACEACHGPGGSHVAANSDPLRRYLLHLGDAPDPSIVNPAHLSAERSADACGRCHGQRITDDVGAFLAHGDPFVPGDDLALYSAPLFIDTTLRDEEVFGDRFWSDGTPRLTAYEYQGLLESRCAVDGQLTCTTCHAMHDGDPAGQIRPSEAGDAMCTHCHEDLGDHPSDAPHPSTACVSCHMPEVVFGIRSVHVSHRIDVPRAAPLLPGERPDACVLCHADLDAERRPVAPTEGALASLLLGGDPIQRSVAASAWTSARVPSELAAALLLEVMQGDPYPAVRAIAWDSLRRREGLAVDRFSATATLSARRAAIAALDLHPASLSSAWVEELARRRSSAAIEIGE